MNNLTIQEVARRSPDLVSGQKYIRAAALLWWICLAGLGHPNYQQAWDSHRSGSGCPVCAKLAVAAFHRHSIDEVADRCPDLAPGQTYVGCEEPLLWKCPAGLGHPNYPQSYISHSQGHGCPECARLTWGASQRLTIEKIAERCSDLIPGQSYINNHSPLLWKCPVGHPDYEQIYNSHQNGRGCPECAYLKKGASQRLSIEQITKNYPELVPGQAYTNSNMQLWWKCVAGLGHPNYLQIYYSHQAGQGCPRCGKYKSENGEFGSHPECSVMNYLADLDIPYAHDGRYNGDARHRWDVMPL